MDKNDSLVKNKNIQIIIFTLFLSPIAIGFLTGYFKGDCNNTKVYFIEMKCSGRVLEKFVDRDNHNNATIKFTDSKQILLHSQLGQRIFKEIEISDSLYKKENSRILKLYKANGEIMEYEETEPDCEYLLK